MDIFSFIVADVRVLLRPARVLAFLQSIEITGLFLFSAAILLENLSVLHRVISFLPLL